MWEARRQQPDPPRPTAPLGGCFRLSEFQPQAGKRVKLSQVGTDNQVLGDREQ